MRQLISTTIISSFALVAAAGAVNAAAHAKKAVGDEVIAAQRAKLAGTTTGSGFGPQSPRDIDVLAGANGRVFEEAPTYAEMNFCNIHFHENAEHRGGDFTNYAGNGDGKGAGTGFKYDGDLSAAELAPVGEKIGEGQYGYLASGDTIEVHYVQPTAQITPGPTLGACLSEAIMNPPTARRSAGLCAGQRWRPRLWRTDRAGHGRWQASGAEHPGQHRRACALCRFNHGTWL